jgi:hypothetical protein
MPESERHTWTDDDARTTWRRWVGWRHNLDDAEILPFHLRDATRDPHWRPAPRTLPTRTPGKHAAPEPEDEEPSPETITVSVVFYERQRRRPTTLQVAVLGGLGLVAVTVGIIAVRSLMGAS